MASNSSILKVNGVLHVGESLVSANQLFCAYLHNDGNLCVYNNPSPSDDGCLWCTGSTTPIKSAHCMCLHEDGNLCAYQDVSPGRDSCYWCLNKSITDKGPHCMCLHDDGNLCIYRSESPDGSKTVWCSGKTDPIEQVDQISRIDYQLAKAEFLDNKIKDIYNLETENNTDVKQSSTLTGNKSMSETCEWNNSISVAIGASATQSLSIGIPTIGEAGGSVTLSAEVCNTYSWGKSKTITKDFGYSIPIEIPPQSTGTIHILMHTSTIKVPYILEGVAKLNSGAMRNISIQGTYIGICSYDLKVDLLCYPLQKNNIVKSIKKVVSTTKGNS